MDIKYKRIVTLSICVILMFAMNLQPVFAADDTAKVAKTVVEKMNIYTNMSKTIKIADPLLKLKWTTSDSKIVTILGTRGKNDSTVTIRTGNKTGQCTVTAKLGKMKYKYVITVKKDAVNFRANLDKLTQTKNKISVKLLMTNNSKKSVTLSQSFKLEKFTKGKWVELKIRDGISIDMQKCITILAPKERVTSSYNISGWYKKADLTKGTYRIFVGSSYKAAYGYAMFKLK